MRRFALLLVFLSGSPSRVSGQADAPRRPLDEVSSSVATIPASVEAAMLELSRLEAALRETPNAYPLLVAASREAAALAVLPAFESNGAGLVTRSHAYAERALMLLPDDVDARFLRAAAMALELDREGPVGKVHMAEEIWSETDVILNADSLHAGAHHLRGRMHAGIMRLGAVTRFVALRMVGGDGLDGASWDAAERHLHKAVELAPSNAMYQVELGVLYRDTGQHERAREVFDRAVDLEPGSPLDLYEIGRAQGFLAELR